MHPTTIDAIRAAMAEAGFAGAYDALAESHAELIAALEFALPLALGADVSRLSDDLYTQWIVQKALSLKVLTKARELVA